jgi:hypothetical protein
MWSFQEIQSNSTMAIRKIRTEVQPPTEREVLEGLGVRWRIPPFDVQRETASIVRAVREGVPAGPTRGDGVVTLVWNGVGQRFVIEYKSPGTPKQVEGAVAQFRRYVGSSSDLRPLIVAPFLKSELLDRLVEEEISAVDLSGNMAITVPGRWLVIRSGAPNRYPSGAPIKNVYRGRSSLVARAMLTMRSAPTVSAVASTLRQSAGLTMPTISKVLRSLEDDVIVARNGGIQVVQPDKLLANLLANYRPPSARRSVRGKIGRDEATMSQLRANADATGVLYAAYLPERYTILPSSDPVVRIYTNSIETLLGGLTIDDQSRFPDVELIETDDPAVYFQREEQGGTYCTSRLQVYLELASGGKREEQAARSIQADLLAGYQ